MVVRVSEVAVVEKPNVADVEDLVVGAIEELGEVLARLEEVREPDQRGEVGSTALEELATQLHLVGFLLVGSLCRVTGR